jgi:hypothetical protein
VQSARRSIARVDDIVTLGFDQTMRRLTLSLIGLGFTFASIIVASSGCEAGADDESGGGGNDGEGAGNSNGPGNPNGSTSDGFATGTTGPGVGGGCAGISVGADKVPLDMYVMLDQSGSMSDPANGGGTRWEAVEAAFNTFVNQPEAAGIGIGIQYFPLDSGVSCPALMCTSDAECGPPGCGPCDMPFPGFGVCPGFGSSDSCEINDYATPDVAIAELPGNAAAITGSIAAHGPVGNTPTLPALQGAIQQAQSFATQNPGHQVIVVLATDGEPNVCGSDVNTVSNAAAMGVAGMPSILTFVIGVGASPATCNAIAAAGGTDQAFLVDQDPNVQQAFLDALNQIQGIALPCSYLIPEPTMGEINFEQVNVQYTPDGGSPETLPKVGSAAECPPGQNAWYYDNNANPTQIILCPDTCTNLSAGENGQVNIVLGCDTVVQ